MAPPNQKREARTREPLESERVPLEREARTREPLESERVPLEREARTREPLQSGRVPVSPRAAEAGILIDAMRSLSAAQSIEQVAEVVRGAARQLLSADGVTFVLKEGAGTYYLDEEAIAPLWKGQRFPSTHCLAGLAMDQQQQLVVTDIEHDARVPLDLYRATFVRSLVMTPVRRQKPVAAIGTYWAHTHRPSQHQLELLQDLADGAARAIEHVQLVRDLERRVEERTQELSLLNGELESFANVVAHDLRSPLSVVMGFGTLIEERQVLPQGDPSREHLHELLCAAQRMETILSSLLSYTRIARVPLHLHALDVSTLAQEVADRLLTRRFSGRSVEFAIEPGLRALADPILLDTLLENLLDHALVGTAQRAHATIRVGKAQDEQGRSVLYVSDDGLGYDARQLERLFVPFQANQRGSTTAAGVGLATCARIVRRHDGRIWATSTEGQGSTIFFSLAPPQVAL